MVKWGAILLIWSSSLVVAFIAGDYYGVQDISESAGDHGRFLGKLAPEWLDDGREMKLTNDFIYIDPRNQPWLAPQGSIVNGASIPQLFWSLMGGPFEGKYRNASVVHDVACEQMTHPSADVHRMFFDACLAGGVPISPAKRLYWAVARFGPRWATETRVRSISTVNPDGVTAQHEVLENVAAPIAVDAPTAAQVEWAQKYFDEHDPSLDEIPFVTGPE